MRDPANGKILPPCNVHLLRKYEYDPIHTDPLQVRTKDMEGMFVIDEVIRHQGQWNKLKSMKFIVKWAGYEDEYEDSWANLKGNIVLHEYMRNRNLQQYIPKKYR